MVKCGAWGVIYGKVRGFAVRIRVKCGAWGEFWVKRVA